MCIIHAVLFIGSGDSGEYKGDLCVREITAFKKPGPAVAVIRRE